MLSTNTKRCIRLFGLASLVLSASVLAADTDNAIENMSGTVTNIAVTAQTTATDTNALATMPTWVLVKPDTTLWRIAVNHTPKGFNPWQTVMSLYQINPKAFRQGDISVLYANTKLRMPTRSQLGALTTRQAKAVYDTLVPASATVSSFKPVSQKPAIAQPDPQNVQAAKLQQQVQDQQNTLNALATQSNVLQTQVNQLKANQTKAFSQQELLATTNQNLAQGVVKQEQELKALNDQRSLIAADMQALGQTFQATRGQLNEAQKDLLQVEKTLAITQNDLKLAQQKKRLVEQAEAEAKVEAEAKAKAEKTTQKLKQAETAKLAQEVQEAKEAKKAQKAKEAKEAKEVKEAKEAKEVEQAKRAQELKQAKAAQLVLADKKAALIEQAEKSPEALPMLEKSTAGRLTTEHIILLLFMLIVFILGALWWAFTRGKKARKVKPKVTQAQAQSRATDKALNTQINVSRASLTNDVNDMLAGHGPMPNDADEPVEYLSHEADMDTKLFLASSYKDMGEVQTAIDILQEVINKGNADQQAQARQLLATIDKA